ncbi:hypothetical protein BUALT_Bualt10G0088100 [Buddleja alternifolia]|uniref:Uncharacterized protein n=1 Tax=Buddleja alternifolia TaxID=168488 RepID=A0AAV6WXW6_9LAMI|nr:hypothetical protein BUALT_Bualt10G0088100 [Buddleja alternifolia]
MGIKAKNNTLVPLILKDYYLWDPNLNSGYYGAVEYRLPAGGKKKLSSSKFARKLMEELKPQEIHVKIGDETRLVLHHDELENIKAIYLEMENVDAGDLTVEMSYKSKQDLDLRYKNPRDPR